MTIQPDPWPTHPPRPSPSTSFPSTPGAHVTGAAWLGETAAFALGDGAVLLAKDGVAHRVAAHPDGAILAAASDGERLVTGGDDGRVAVHRRRTGRHARSPTRRALDRRARASSRRGRRLERRQARYGAGRQGRASRPSRRPPRCGACASRPRAIGSPPPTTTAQPCGFPNIEAEPEFLEWKGSHLDVTWSPDGRFVVTSMQENALHGWRLQPDSGTCA